MSKSFKFFLNSNIINCCNKTRSSNCNLKGNRRVQQLVRNGSQFGLHTRNSTHRSILQLVSKARLSSISSNLPFLPYSMIIVSIVWSFLKCSPGPVILLKQVWPFTIIVTCQRIKCTILKILDWFEFEVFRALPLTAIFWE